MTPAIGIMIGLYIALRCVELLCSAKERFTQGKKFAVDFTATLVLVVTAFALADFLSQIAAAKGWR